jgi:hypothetical protein
MNPPRQRRDSGFALLLVFAMAAIVGMMLYLELPRVAFEAQRTREELLIRRGEEYKHAIKLFYRRFQRYPPSLDALENTNNIRFLRRRYKDPMTGKDEWRLIHAGPGGIFTDSLTQKPLQAPQQKKDDMFTSVSDMSAATNSESQQPVVSMVPRRRPSDGVQIPGGGFSGGVLPANPDLGQAAPPDQSAQLPPVDSGQPVQPTPYQPGQPGQPGQPVFPGAQPGQPGQPGQMYPGFQPGQAGQPGPTAGSASGPGTTPVPGLIDNMLRNPPGQNALGGTPVTVGGGIAGVASKMEAQGIKIYNDRKKYNEWEFLYDPRKELAAQMTALQSGLQQPVMPGATSQPGQQPGQQPPTPITSFGSQGPNQR